MRKCEHCGTTIDKGKPFSYEGHDFCCECMSEFCSWWLDGGFVENPKQFEHLGIGPDD